MPQVIFHGVRGSYPCPGPEFAEFGGNTACIEFRQEDGQPILFDLGTGITRLASQIENQDSYSAAALVSHTHWDHIQGLPFFTPLHHPGTHLDIYSPFDSRSSLIEAFDKAFTPPLFPVAWDQLGGKLIFHELSSFQFAIGSVSVKCARVPHPGVSYGYRIDDRGVSLAYVSDHQMPEDRQAISSEVLELCHNVDVLVHDAQYTNEEFLSKSDWGHCTIEYAIHVALSAGARTLIIFHHDPSHNDTIMRHISVQAGKSAEKFNLNLVVAKEGMTIDL